MPRSVPPDRLERLLAAAAAAFVEHGFARTQMDDVAHRLGVSKGTVYRSVVSKEALFVAVLDFADHPASAPENPLDEADLAEGARRLRARLAADPAAHRLAAALSRSEPGTETATFAADVERAACDLFDLLSAHRVGVMVLDRCAPELPALAAEWYGPGRYAVVDAWAGYLERHAPVVARGVPADVLARSITELVATWAVKMPWDPEPRPSHPELSRVSAAMVRNLVIGAPR